MFKLILTADACYSHLTHGEPKKWTNYSCIWWRKKPIQTSALYHE